VQYLRVELPEAKILRPLRRVELAQVR